MVENGTVTHAEQHQQNHHHHHHHHHNHHHNHNNQHSDQLADKECENLPNKSPIIIDNFVLPSNCVPLTHQASQYNQVWL
jgi:hypothetical protein